MAQESIAKYHTEDHGQVTSLQSYGLGSRSLLAAMINSTLRPNTATYASLAVAATTVLGGAGFATHIHIFHEKSQHAHACEHTVKQSVVNREISSAKHTCYHSNSGSGHSAINPPNLETKRKQVERGHCTASAKQCKHASKHGPPCCASWWLLLRTCG